MFIFLLHSDSSQMVACQAIKEQWLVALPTQHESARQRQTLTPQLHS